MAGILWTVLVILLILWALGFFVANLGSIVHILLVLAVIVLVYNLLTGRGARVSPTRSPARRRPRIPDSTWAAGDMPAASTSTRARAAG